MNRIHHLTLIVIVSWGSAGLAGEVNSLGVIRVREGGGGSSGCWTTNVERPSSLPGGGFISCSLQSCNDLGCTKYRCSVSTTSSISSSSSSSTEKYEHEVHEAKDEK